MTAATPGPIEKILRAAAVGSGCADDDALREALASAALGGGRWVDTLLDAGVLPDEAGFFWKLGPAVGMDFAEHPVPDAGQAMHTRLPARLALRHRLLPASADEAELVLHTYDPFDLEARQMTGRMIDRKVSWILSPRSTVIEALRQGYGVGAERFEDLIDGRTAGSGDDALRQEVTVLDDNEEATVMSFVNQIFSEAIRERATDIHIEPLESDVRIRYRVDGALNEVAVPPNVRLLQNALVSRLKIMAHLDIAERRLPQDGRINLELNGQRFDVRVATIPSVNGESVSLRLLGRERMELGALGLTESLEAQVRELLALPNGIILVTGPTGSGKSSTLYTFLRELNTKDRRIVTIEDPVENKLDGVVQIAVKPEINLTFSAGLRSILRGDPNVIMVGEMRDLETTEIAIRGALTGHLVFSTLHTNDAVGGISRLVDMGIEPFLIASSVRAFLAQRLVRRLCPHCRRPAEEHQGHDGYLESLGFPVDQKHRILTAVGCRECRGTGYRGRMAIIEICAVTPAMQELVAARAPVSALRLRAREQGMLPMRDYGWLKVISGETTLEEVIAVTAADHGA
ncbi:MAG: Secretion system protein [Verrucomicrobiales bacterium]|nr:Secretion system protein [Verrucomicrobiales bacterium]